MPPENLPAVPDEPGEILEGEIVDQPPAVPARVVKVVVVVVKHPAVRHPARHAAYIPIGAAVVVKRVWESRTTARYERWIRAAEATGSHEAALAWDERRSRFLKDRHQRRMEWLELPGKVAQRAVWVAGSGIGVLGVTGVFMAIAEKDIGEVAVPFEAVSHVVMWIVIAISVSYGPVLLAAPWIGLAALWQVGRTQGRLPAWAATAADPDADVAVDETTIARALEGLRIPQIRDHLKAGLPLQYITTCRQEGRGTYCQIRLPVGVTAERIARRRADLATGLYRQAKETWPSTGSEAGILELWVADKGALAEGAGPYPLLEAGFTDVFRGVPFGRTLRGDPLDAPLMERNTIIGGIPGQGKSSSARAIMLGAALDYRAELRIYVPDVNFDFEAFGPRCSQYLMGADDETIERIRDRLAELEAEVQARGALLVRHAAAAVTPELASAGIGLHPLFVLLEECHVAFAHEEHGKAIAKSFTNVVRLGRKRGVHLVPSTQAPTKDSIPRDVTRNCSNGIAHAVGDHVANDALLGQGAYKAGHRATELIPGTDKGVALVKGFTGERSVMVQAYFVDVADVPGITDRALAEIARRGLEVPGSGHARVIEQRDLLDDVRAVMRTERVLLRDLLGLLRDLAPAWAPYRSMTATALREQLRERGVRVINSSGTYWLDPGDVPGGETAFDD